MKNGINRKDIVIIAVSSIAALASITAIVLLILNNAMVKRSNEIAEEALQIAYESNLPAITAIYSIRNDDNNDPDSVTIEAYSAQGPVYETRTYIHTLIYINAENVEGIADNQLNNNDAYLAVYNCFTAEPIGALNTQGPLFIETSNKGLLSRFDAMEYSFHESAAEDGYVSDIQLHYYLEIEYNDYTGERHRKYFILEQFGSFEVDETTMKNTLDTAIGNLASAMNEEDISPDIYQMDGAGLWKWFKQQILT